MNEFKNTVNSLNQLDIDEQQQIFFKELNEKRLELAYNFVKPISGLVSYGSI